ncbi:RHS repeat domain-containing protein [Agarivorans sp. QJM3NY_25]|uniref:RHS repeat domain-containing protein n=1 Tax=Agarivorans sp. QJM3NY_25 TaxID=3421430 RepID=UPI003D7C92BA
MGRTALIEFDVLGRILKVTSPGGITETRSYYGASQNGQLKSIKYIDDEGKTHEQKYSYDNIGRVKQQQNLLDAHVLATTWYHYHNSASLSGVSDVDSVLYYNERGQVRYKVSPTALNIRTKQEERAVEYYEYDTVGNMKKVFAGLTTSVTSLPSSNLLTKLAEYGYDDLGRIATVKDGNGHLIQQNTYDKHGNLTATKDAKNQVTNYEYNATNGQLDSIHPSGSNNSIYYQYNALGAVSQVSSPATTTTYGFDALNRVAKVVDSRANKTLSYLYSPAGKLLTMNGPEGDNTQYKYDPSGRLVSVVTPSQEQITYFWNADDQIGQISYSNGVSQYYEYRKDGNISSIVVDNGNGQLAEMKYEYNERSLLSAASETITGVGSQSFEYSYDNLDRLSTVKSNNGSIETFNYDEFNNRSKRSYGGVDYYYNYDMLNFGRLTNIRTGSSSGAYYRCYQYDANHAVVKKYNGSCTGTATTQLQYNSLKQVFKYSYAGETRFYQYDDQGRRISENDTQWLYSGDNLVAAHNVKGELKSLFTYGPGIDNPIHYMGPGGNQFLTANRLNSVVLATNAAGNRTASQLYNAFGTKSIGNGSLPQFGYTGREPNIGGVIYSRARWYDPEMGRFLQPDPLGYVDGINRFAYVRNNPLMFTDPYGTESFNVENIINAVEDGLSEYAANSWASATSESPSDAAFRMLQGMGPEVSVLAEGALATEAALTIRNSKYVDEVITLLNRPKVTKYGLTKAQTKIALTTAQEAYKGSTRVGHALSKHAGRKPEIWGKTTGSMKTWNEQAMKHIREITRGSGEFKQVTDKGNTFLEKRLSDGRGIRLNMDSTFKGFVD